MEKLWMDLYYEAVDSAYLTLDDCPPGGQPPEGVPDTFIPYVRLWEQEEGIQNNRELV